jgi:hypothetical protein
VVRLDTSWGSNGKRACPFETGHVCCKVFGGSLADYVGECLVLIAGDVGIAAVVLLHNAFGVCSSWAQLRNTVVRPLPIKLLVGVGRGKAQGRM